MRVYALLLGVALTTGYGYAAQIALSSVGASRYTPAASPAASAAGHPGSVWYGGVLDPVTVESKSDGARPASTKNQVLSRPTVRCIEAARSGFRAAS